MKISTNWLADYIGRGYDAETLAERITLAGLEVEEVTRVGASLDGVVVGHVLEVAAHPDADRLRVCRVDIGTEMSQIVCGAPNVAAGQKVAVATIGTTLPFTDAKGNPVVMKKAKIRGVESSGMICAEDELGLGTNHDGIMVLKEDLVPGSSFAQAIDHQVDFVLEIGLTPNRPDAACHYGVARDLSSALDIDLIEPANLPEHTELSPVQWEIVNQHPDVRIEIEDTDGCGRYVGILIRGVKVGPSPSWLQDRLSAIGLRSLNNVVDATNYVLHELGQPLHAFDFDHIADQKIVVKSFAHNTAFTTLDGQKRDIPAAGLFICDGQQPVALAGIMGGLNSEVTDITKDILIESAWFNPVRIRKTSKAVALQTDASYRFERGVDPELACKAAMRCASIIQALAGGTIDTRVLDVHPVKHIPTNIQLRHTRISALIGVDPGAERVEQILKRLGFQITPENPREWSVGVPSWRPDVTREVDLIEEIARIYDYNKIPGPEKVAYMKPGPLGDHERFIREVRSVSRSAGFREIYTISLMPAPLAGLFAPEAEQIHTLNPISQDQAVMRPDLRFGFLRSAAHNFNRGAEGVAFFETGNVFRKSEYDATWIPGIREEVQLLFGVAGIHVPASWQAAAQNWDGFALKSRTEGFLRSLGLRGDKLKCTLDEEAVVWSWKKIRIARMERISDEMLKAFDIKFPAWVCTIYLTPLEPIISSLGTRVFEPLPKFPSIDYDVAFVTDSSVSALALENEIRQIAGNRLMSLSVFDVFEGASLGADKKSIAFRLEFLDKTKTLTINDIEPIIQKIVKRLDQQFSARLRA